MLQARSEESQAATTDLLTPAAAAADSHRGLRGLGSRNSWFLAADSDQFSFVQRTDSGSQDLTGFKDG